MQHFVIQTAAKWTMDHRLFKWMQHFVFETDATDHRLSTAQYDAAFCPLDSYDMDYRPWTID